MYYVIIILLSGKLQFDSYVKLQLTIILCLLEYNFPLNNINMIVNITNYNIYLMLPLIGVFLGGYSWHNYLILNSIGTLIQMCNSHL